jgi:hypothetical protein
MDICIIKSLSEIAQNEHENFKAFKEKVVEYCIREKAVLNVFRVLNSIKTELHCCLSGKTKVDVDRAMIIKVMRTIQTEIDIIRYKIEFPGLVEIASSKAVKPVGVWTEDKICLIELVYAIYHSRAINNGSVTIKAIKECFEYIFQVDLGNIHDRTKELAIKKERRKLYLETMILNLNYFLDKLNS